MSEANRVGLLQEEQNRGKPNWEHLNDELHVLITVEDSENRAKLKLERAVEEVKKLLTVVSLNHAKIYPLMADNREGCKLLVFRQKTIQCWPNSFFLLPLKNSFSFCNVPHIFLSTHFDDSEDNDEGADDGREFWRIDGGFCGQLFSKGKVGRVSKTDEAQGELRLYTVDTIFTFTYSQTH